MATFALLIFLLATALWVRTRILRGAGFLRSRSLEQRQRIATASDIGFIALAVCLLIASVVSGFVVTASTASDTIPIVLLGLALILLPVLRDILAFAVLKLERRLRVSDYIECDRIRGQVERLAVRSTLVRTLEGVAVVVPNHFLLSHPLNHWSLGTSISRIVVPVEAPTSLDPAQVKELLLDCSRSATLIVSDPAPDVMFLGQRGDRLHFQLRVWIADKRLEAEAISQLNYPIDRCLRDATGHNSDIASVSATPSRSVASGSVASGSTTSESAVSGPKAIPASSLITPPPTPSTSSDSKPSDSQLHNSKLSDSPPSTSSSPASSRSTSGDPL
ncbi:MAG: mechanosensitive ion channel domain-containing protein [Cyanobacteria bacterium P01_A01_bin.3]